MAKENKITIKNNQNDPFSKLLNKATPPEVERKSNLAEILEEIAEICSETNEDFTKDELNKKDQVR